MDIMNFKELINAQQEQIDELERLNAQYAISLREKNKKIEDLCEEIYELREKVSNSKSMKRCEIWDGDELIAEIRKPNITEKDLIDVLEELEMDEDSLNERIRILKQIDFSVKVERKLSVNLE